MNYLEMTREQMEVHLTLLGWEVFKLSTPIGGYLRNSNVCVSLDPHNEPVSYVSVFDRKLLVPESWDSISTERLFTMAYFIIEKDLP